MATIETFTERAQALIGGLSPRSATFDLFVDLARRKVDRVRPRIYRNAITGDGSDEHALPSPWLQGFSTIISIGVQESSDEAPSTLTNEDFVIERDTSGNDQIRLVGWAPAATETLVVIHTAPHTIDDTTSTLLATDESAFAELVAAIALRSVLASVIGNADQRTDSDRAAVDVAQAEQVTALMREYRRSAYSHFGIVDETNEPSATPGQAIRDTDRVRTTASTRWYRHTHPERTH